MIHFPFLGVKDVSLGCNLLGVLSQLPFSHAFFQLEEGLKTSRENQSSNF